MSEKDDKWGKYVGTYHFVFPEPQVMPLYWRSETSGRMAAIVGKFLSDDDDLTVEELDLLTWYVYQWVDAMPSPPLDHRKRLLDVRNKADLRKLCHEWWRSMNIDPF